ncbi:MAG: site-2 protease family protein, partial [Oscillospiraceae bacterium]|nr:site-2 protease family protein [Oscillospiraceae bacterium]
GNRLKYSWYNTVDFARLVRLSIMMLVRGDAGIDDLSGPVGIVSSITKVGEETQKEAGVLAALENVFFFGAMIAVNLAVMNLLPIPALDGGRIFFLVVNTLALAIFKRKIPEKYENYIHAAGFILLMALMLFVTFNDVTKLF